MSDRTKSILHLLGVFVTGGLGTLTVVMQHSPHAWAPAAGTILAALLTDLKQAFPGMFPPASVLLLAGSVAFATVAPACWLTKPPPASPGAPDGGFIDASAGTRLVDCADSAIHAAAVGLMPAIETGLATGNVEAALIAVGVDVGSPLVVAEVACGIHYIIARITHSQHNAPDSLEATKLDNAQAWLAAHPGVQVTNAVSP